MTTSIGSQQKQSPEKGIPEGGPIPLHRDTTILLCYVVNPMISKVNLDSEPRFGRAQHSFFLLGEVIIVEMSLFPLG